MSKCKINACMITISIEIYLIIEIINIAIITIQSQFNAILFNKTEPSLRLEEFHINSYNFTSYFNQCTLTN